MTVQIVKTEDLSQHCLEFQERGYTVFHNLFNQDQVAKWKNKYYQMIQELFGDAHQLNYCVTDMVERSPSTMLPFTANPVILDFLELVMGPFVQIGDANMNGSVPISKEEASNKVNGWHRDMYAFVPKGTDYQIPRQILALTYLEDMTGENGPLRVIPGSHRKDTIMNANERNIPHPDELVLSLKAGDVIVFSGILHSGSPNISDRHRIFMGGMYTYSWYKHNCNFNGPNIQRLIAQATDKNDLRMLRLLGVHGPVEKARINSGFIFPDEIQWKEWISQDQAALKGPSDWWKSAQG